MDTENKPSADPRAERIVELNRELDMLLYAISHDLGAPLRSIDGFSQALLEDYADALDDQARDYLLRVRSAGKRVNAYVNALLTMSRQTRGELHLQEVDLGQLALEIVAGLRRKDPGRIVEVVIGQGLAVRMDWTMARTLMERLLDNAWKFTVPAPEARIEVGRQAGEGGTVFFVRDSGVGIDMVYASKRLFGVFQRMHGDTEFAGLGTGLATARRIVNRHGGSIWADSEPGRGTTVFFTTGRL